MPSGLHRTYGAHHLHFITWSCYRRLPFLNSAATRDRFLSILEQVRVRYRFVVVGYVVMPEHVHLLVTEPEIGTPSKLMQVLKQRTARALLPKRKRRNPRQRNLFGDEPQPRPFWQAFLRLQCVVDEEARGKTQVHASQPGKAGIGGIAGTVGLEQLSFLSARGSWTGAGERGLDRDFVSPPCGVRNAKALTAGIWNSRPCKNRKDGAPAALVIPAKLRAWATRPGEHGLDRDFVSPPHRMRNAKALTAGI